MSKPSENPGDAGREMTTSAPEPVLLGAEVKKAALIERVVLMTGQRKAEVKPVIEATLAALGQALSDGETLNLHPFGKARATKKKDLSNGQAMVVRLRRSTRAIESTKGLAKGNAEG